MGTLTCITVKFSCSLLLGAVHNLFSTSDIIMTSPCNPSLLSVTIYFPLQLPTSVLVYGRLYSLIFRNHVTAPPTVTMTLCVGKKCEHPLKSYFLFLHVFISLFDLYNSPVCSCQVHTIVTCVALSSSVSSISVFIVPLLHFAGYQKTWL